MYWYVKSGSMYEEANPDFPRRISMDSPPRRPPFLHSSFLLIQLPFHTCLREVNITIHAGYWGEGSQAGCATTVKA